MTSETDLERAPDSTSYGWACAIFAALAGGGVWQGWYGVATFFALLALAAGFATGMAEVAREVRRVAVLLRERPR